MTVTGETSEDAEMRPQGSYTTLSGSARSGLRSPRQPCAHLSTARWNTMQDSRPLQPLEYHIKFPALFDRGLAKGSRASLGRSYLDYQRVVARLSVSELWAGQQRLH